MKGLWLEVVVAYLKVIFRYLVHANLAIPPVDAFPHPAVPNTNATLSA